MEMVKILPTMGSCQQEFYCMLLVELHVYIQVGNITSHLLSVAYRLIGVDKIALSIAQNLKWADLGALIRMDDVEHSLSQAGSHPKLQKGQSYATLPLKRLIDDCSFHWAQTSHAVDICMQIQMYVQLNPLLVHVPESV